MWENFSPNLHCIYFPSCQFQNQLPIFHKKFSSYVLLLIAHQMEVFKSISSSEHVMWYLILYLLMFVLYSITSKFWNLFFWCFQRPWFISDTRRMLLKICESENSTVVTFITRYIIWSWAFLFQLSHTCSLQTRYNWLTLCCYLALDGFQSY